jgi:hypothetical protein
VAETKLSPIKELEAKEEENLGAELVSNRADSVSKASPIRHEIADENI